MDDLVAEELDTEMLGRKCWSYVFMLCFGWRRDTVIWKKPGKLDPASNSSLLRSSTVDGIVWSA
jgi:hypothetical protein